MTVLAVIPARGGSKGTLPGDMIGGFESLGDRSTRE